jgi:hypothetical protein
MITSAIHSSSTAPGFHKIRPVLMKLRPNLKRAPGTDKSRTHSIDQGFPSKMPERRRIVCQTAAKFNQEFHPTRQMLLGQATLPGMTKTTMQTLTMMKFWRQWKASSVQSKHPNLTIRALSHDQMKKKWCCWRAHSHLQIGRSHHQMF